LVDGYCSQPNLHEEPRAAQASLHPPAVVATKPKKNKKLPKHKQNHHHTTSDRLKTQSRTKSPKSKTKCNKIERKFN